MSPPSLARATFTLLAGGVAAQVLPLLLGPWISRLYTPAEFGAFSLTWTLASNIAVVACARYEFALALEADEGEAAAAVVYTGRPRACIPCENWR